MQSIAKQEGGGQQGETGREELFKFLLKILNILNIMRDFSLLTVVMIAWTATINRVMETNTDAGLSRRSSHNIQRNGARKCTVGRRH